VNGQTRDTNFEEIKLYLGKGFINFFHNVAQCDESCPSIGMIL